MSDICTNVWVSIFRALVLVISLKTLTEWWALEDVVGEQFRNKVSKKRGIWQSPNDCLYEEKGFEKNSASHEITSSKSDNILVVVLLLCRALLFLACTTFSVSCCSVFLFGLVPSWFLRVPILQNTWCISCVVGVTTKRLHFEGMVGREHEWKTDFIVLLQRLHEMKWL